MIKKTIRILIITKEAEFAKGIIPEILPESEYAVKCATHTKSSSAKHLINKGTVDLLIIATNLSNGNTEKLMDLARGFKPKMPIIGIFDTEDAVYELYLRRKYRASQYFIQDDFSYDLSEMVIEAYEEVLSQKRRLIEFPQLTFKKDQTCFVTTNGRYIVATIYDFDKKTFSTADSHMNMTEFMEEHNTEGDFLRCHSSWIVNRWLIQKIRRGEGYITLWVTDEKGDEIRIPIGKSYRKNIVAFLKGELF